MKSTYRKSALDKISSPEQLDKVLKVTSPLSWLALLGITLIIVFVVVWSIVGTLPSTVTAAGVIVRSNTSTNTILSTQRGTVQRILTKAGNPVYKGTEVLELSTNTGTEMITTDFVGTVTEILVEQGSTVENGTEVFRVKPAMTENQKEIVVCYVPVTDADKIKRGMEVTVSLTSADSNVYGHMTGRVINIDTFATSQKAIASVVGNDNGMVSVLGGDGKGVCAVSCELMIDPDTVSGYAWSNGKGREVMLTAPQLCSVRIVTERVPPISKLFAKLKDIWGSK